MNAPFAIPAAVTNPLATTAMLVGVKISGWSARKLDRDASKKVNDDHEAAEDAGRFNKLLIAKESLEAITKAQNGARHDHYEKTLPWADEGLRILPAASYGLYAAMMQKRRREFEGAVDDFAMAYPALITEAKKRLGGLYKADDFPDPTRIRERFSFDVRVLPMPDATDFRIELAGGRSDQIRADIEASMQQALDTAMGDAWARITDKVGRMVERLNAYKPGVSGTRAEGTFRDSLVLNLRDLVEVLPSFNLTNDPVLAATIGRMRDELCVANAQDLRDNDRLREETAAAAASILADVSAYLA